jgi:hypothetical protein
MNDTQANNTRNVLLNSYSKPIPFFEFSSASPGSGTMTAKGWFYTLDWRYYSQTATNAVDNTAIISEIVSTIGSNFIPQTIIDNLAGISSSRYRDGITT